MELKVMDENEDLSPSGKQLRMLFHLGVSTSRRKYMTNKVASSVIGRSLAEQYRQYQQRRAEQAALEQLRNTAAAAAWTKLDELENRHREADWEEIQKRFEVVAEDSSNQRNGDVQSATQRMKG